MGPVGNGLQGIGWPDQAEDYLIKVCSRGEFRGRATLRSTIFRLLGDVKAHRMYC
jgi:hypothetical protein